MAWALVFLHVLLPLIVAGTAGFGAWRCWRLLRYASDLRLLRLAWFYGLFAASLVPLAVWNGEVASSVSDTSLPNLHFAFAAAQTVDIFLLAHHALMIASLTVATLAFGHGHKKELKVGAFAFVGIALGFVGGAPLVPVLLGIEALLTLHLAVRAVMNHLHRKTPGAVRVASGFLLFFLGHLSYFLLYQPGAVRSPIGDAVALAGVVVLVRLLPRPSA